MTQRLLVYCEGQTEEMIVNRLLRQRLRLYGIKVENPVLAATSSDPRGQRGGLVNWDAVALDLRSLFESDPDPNLRFTTFFDLYAMPKKVLKLAGFDAPVSDVADVVTLERAMESAFAEPRFKAYLQRHELEALLLADFEALVRVFHRDRSGLERLQQDIAPFPTPEDINHGTDTHPSARLSAAIDGYENKKCANAYWVLAEGNMDTVRAKCPRFHAWLQHWEAWGRPK